MVFFDYANNTGYEYSQSRADADFFMGYFITAANGIADNITSYKWASTVFNPLFHQKFANIPLKA